MKTLKLFYSNSHETKFESEVTDCVRLPDGRSAVILERTAFFSGGGGHPVDRGNLAKVPLLDVAEQDDGRIWHIMEREIPVGCLVEGEVDWEYRRSLIQHHTAEHMVSGLVRRLFGYKNVGFHMGESMVTIDFSDELNAQQIEEVERLANIAVYDNLQVKSEYPPPKVLVNMDYRSKREIEGMVRIVSIPNIDCCACCGLHVRWTGEIGLIKLLAPQRYKGGTRLGLVCGEQALADYRMKDLETQKISGLLSARQGEISDAVKRLQDEHEEAKHKLDMAGRRVVELRCALIGEDRMPCVFEKEYDVTQLRLAAQILSEARGGLCAVFSGDDAEGYRYALGSIVEDARTAAQKMNQELNGRGGGSERLVQGSILSNREAIECFFEMRQG